MKRGTLDISIEHRTKHNGSSLNKIKKIHSFRINERNHVFIESIKETVGLAVLKTKVKYRKYTNHTNSDFILVQAPNQYSPMWKTQDLV